LVADGQWEEENDGSGSIKDFRNKMWSMANREKEDFWVPYAWNEGEVGFFI
jgi:DNA-directed RNA polymerase-3 subunit RPC5